MINLDLLADPLPGDSPCGLDLDLEGDTDYLNFFASTEALLPRSYFEVTDGEGNKRRFDPNTIKFEDIFERARPLLERTRDLRLNVFLAKAAILSRDLASFTQCIEAVTLLLDRDWDDVHPRPEDGDLMHRQFAIEALDALTTVVIPLQFHPLLNSRRYGWVSYRTWLIAKGEAAARDDDLVLDRATLDQIVSGAEIDQVKDIAAAFSYLGSILARLGQVWHERSGGDVQPTLTHLLAVVAGVDALLLDVLRQRDPASIVSAEPAPTVSAGGREAVPLPVAVDSVSTIAQATVALRAAAGYFQQSEPSSPALLLVLQAEQMLGKSFVEALRILLPSHVDSATINIGKDRFFDLPVERMADLLEQSEKQAGEGGADASPVPVVTQRHEALALLEQVGSFYRRVEPSSPVPYLTDRARELAQRDFLSLLRDVLPEGVLRTLDHQA